MSEKIFKCDPDGLVLSCADEFHMCDGNWWLLDRGFWSPVGSFAHYNCDSLRPLRLYGESGDDGKIIPIGRLVDDTATPHYRPLTDAERKELGLEVVQAEPAVDPAPTVAAPSRPRVVFKWSVERDGLVICGWRLVVDRIECGDIIEKPDHTFQVARIKLDERGTFKAAVGKTIEGHDNLADAKEYVRTALGIPAEDIKEERK